MSPLAARIRPRSCARYRRHLPDERRSAPRSCGQRRIV
ncbi:hypothetical protein L810_0506 [Burkholderia sp. AU4i]|nr:hypothetical protein L810_0506 [Burkholderia sp. AU4i]